MSYFRTNLNLWWYLTMIGHDLFFSWLQLRYENPKQQYLYDSTVVKLSNNFCIANSTVNSQPFLYLTSVSYALLRSLFPTALSLTTWGAFPKLSLLILLLIFVIIQSSLSLWHVCFSSNHLESVAWRSMMCSYSHLSLTQMKLSGV